MAAAAVEGGLPTHCTTTHTLSPHCTSTQAPPLRVALDGHSQWWSPAAPPHPAPLYCTTQTQAAVESATPGQEEREVDGVGATGTTVEGQGLPHQTLCGKEAKAADRGSTPPNTTERSCASDNREARGCGLGAKRSCQGPPERGLTECRPHGVRVRGLKLVPGKPARGLTECRNGWSLKLGQTVGRTGRQRGVCSPKYT